MNPMDLFALTPVAWTTAMPWMLFGSQAESDAAIASRHAYAVWERA